MSDDRSPLDDGMCQTARSTGFSAGKTPIPEREEHDMAFKMTLEQLEEGRRFASAVTDPKRRHVVQFGWSDGIMVQYDTARKLYRYKLPLPSDEIERFSDDDPWEKPAD